MDKELISVIVPIYNVERYLEECINSIISQTYTNLEIILVDDGSPDNSGKICDEYAKKDKRIKVIHKENGGLSHARNVGINIANGKYIAFIDSDDFIKNTFIETLYNLCQNSNSEIAICDFIEFENNIEISKNEISKNEKMTNIEILKKFCEEDYVKVTVAWNKLYLKELFEKLRFPNGKINEDEFTTYKLIWKARNVAITNEKLYYYRIRENSITREKFNLKRLDYLEALEERMDFFKINNQEYFYKKTLNLYAYQIIEYYYLLKKYINNSESKQKELFDKFSEKYKEINKLRVSKKRKIKHLMFRYCPNLLMKILKIEC